jgi:hypothetical protein
MAAFGLILCRTVFGDDSGDEGGHALAKALYGFGNWLGEAILSPIRADPVPGITTTHLIRASDVLAGHFR